MKRFVFYPALILLLGCNTSRVLYRTEQTPTSYISGPDRECISAIVGGVTSIATGSPWPAVALGLPRDVGSLISAPAKVADNLTTITVEGR